MNKELQRGFLMNLNSKGKKWTAVVLVIVALAAGGGYFAFHRESTPAQQPILPPVKASSKVVAEGKVIPVKYSVLSFSVSGIIYRRFLWLRETK